MATRTDLVGEVFAVVGRFRRQLRRSAGRGFDATGLTEAQAELLRLVGRRPDISVRDAAAELGLVPNTASTLVSKLASDGLVGRLRLTDSAQHVADASRAAGRAALSDVLDELDAHQLDALSRGLSVMADITRRLQERH
jgi:DNA-binding MarR family transcriptional regulator